jgi:hypothetical protein
MWIRKAMLFQLPIHICLDKHTFRYFSFKYLPAVPNQNLSPRETPSQHPYRITIRPWLLSRSSSSAQASPGSPPPSPYANKATPSPCSKSHPSTKKQEHQSMSLKHDEVEFEKSAMMSRFATSRLVLSCGLGKDRIADGERVALWRLRPVPQALCLDDYSAALLACCVGSGKGKQTTLTAWLQR